MGWYVMAVVDTLDYLPVDHEQRGQIIGIFERLANALIHVQDQETGLWPHLLDQPGRERNYLEASGTSMFVYALAKGVRKGYLSGKFKAIAEKGYQGLLQHLLQTDQEGALSLTQCNGGAGLGGTPYRDGSYEYYVTESIRINDPKSVAPFILAGVEMELA
ncbi:Unsaturated rhamnogalacturonyl hydrolase YteR [compost metagenome]